MFKRILKWTGFAVLAALLLVSGAVMLRQHRVFDAPYPKIVRSTDSTVLARGKYLVYGPAHCADCHGKVGGEAAVNRGEIVDLPGGRAFPVEIGTIYARNISSDPETGVGAWPDSVLARSLRHGVGHDGRALFAFMPFTNMSESDLTAVISYIRTLNPVRNKVQENEMNLLGKIIKAFVIQPVGPSGTPPAILPIDTTAAYGEYMAKAVANCYGCHTDRDLRTGAFVGQPFAGGFHVDSPVDPTHYQCVSRNITPDPQTGRIYGWTFTQFQERFRKGKLIEHSAMPWGPFSRMSDEELKAIYNFLQTVKPVHNEIKEVLIAKKS
jgi:mono/diheme cytochrome c family protein